MDCHGLNHVGDARRLHGISTSQFTVKLQAFGASFTGEVEAASFELDSSCLMVRAAD